MVWALGFRGGWFVDGMAATLQDIVAVSAT